MLMSKSDVQRILMESLKENQSDLKEKKQPRDKNTGILAGVIGVGAGGGNVAHLLTGKNFITAAFNTSKADVSGINVDAKIILPGIDGSGRDRAFSANEFKKSYKSFFAHDKIKQLLENDIIFIVGTGGGGTGTILSIMIAGYLKHEYPNKTVFIIGILGSIKEDLISQKNMLEFMHDLESKSAGCPYLLFDNNKVKTLGDSVYDTVNQEIANTIRILSKNYMIENTRSNIDSRDYARLTSFSGLMSVISINNLNISVAEEFIDIKPRIIDAITKSTAVITREPDAYAFFLNTNPENYSMIDLTFNDIQEELGRPTAGLVFKHLQNNSEEGPEMAVIMTGMVSPVTRFAMIQKRIDEYKNMKEKSKLPDIERSSALNLVGDRNKSDVGAGDDFLNDF